MPATGPNRRTAHAFAPAAARWSVCATLWALSLYAADQGGAEAHALIASLNSALLDGNGKVMVALFDPRMPGYKRLSRDILQFTKLSTGRSTIEFLGNTGSDQARDLDLNWHMQIRSYNGQSSTERRARVKIHAEKENGEWRITAFAPLEFFTPAHTGAVWDLISDAVTALTEVSGDPHTASPPVPARFLAAFDPKMASFDQLRANVTGLLAQGNLESSVEMMSNDGDDRRREVELDWSLSLVNRITKIAIFHREEHIKCRLEREHGKWRIVSLDPLSFLAPPPPDKPAAAK